MIGATAVALFFLLYDVVVDCCRLIQDRRIAVSVLQNYRTAPCSHHLRPFSHDLPAGNRIAQNTLQLCHVVNWDIFLNFLRERNVVRRNTLTDQRIERV